MTGADGLMSRNFLEASLDNRFRHNATWPIDRAELAALIDMGLSNAQIGDYFAVGPDDVHMLRDRYGLIGKGAR